VEYTHANRVPAPLASIFGHIPPDSELPPSCAVDGGFAASARRPARALVDQWSRPTPRDEVWLSLADMP